MKDDNWHERPGQNVFRSGAAADRFRIFLSDKGRNPVVEEPENAGSAYPVWRVYFDPSPRLPKDRHSQPIHLQHWGRPEYRADYGNNIASRPDFERCSVHVMGNYSGGQCRNKARYDPDYTGKPTRCKVHSRAHLEAKAAAERAKWAENRSRREATYRRREAADEALTLIEQIADGHNNPRGAAEDLLVKFGFRQTPDEAY